MKWLIKTKLCLVIFEISNHIYLNQVIIDRYETVTHIISECSKMAQKEYKTRHDWVGMVIHWELCKKLKLDHADKGYMHKPESFLENEMQTIFGKLKIQMDHSIPTRRPDLVLINKKK